MRELMSSFLSNDSAFGRAMTHAGVVIGANVMFVLFSLPVVTMGAAWAALEFTIMRMERGDGVINPFREFWKGFRTNFKQATIVELIAAVIALVLYTEIRFTQQVQSAVTSFRIPLIALLIAEISILLWLYPVMAAFEDSLVHLLRNTLYFMFRRIWALPILLFFHLFSLYLSYTDTQFQPLYAFIWTFFGFGLLALLDAKLMLPVFVPYLPLVDEYGDMILEPEREGEGEEFPDFEQAPAAGAPSAAQKSEREILEEMEKMGF